MFNLFGKTYEIIVCDENQNRLYTVKGSRGEMLDFAKILIGEEKWGTCTYEWMKRTLVVWV